MLGKRVGSYHIIEKLAEGGMGEIYLARHRLLDREVVIKVLQPQYTHNPGLVRRFFNEARAAASIDHPGVVSVHELGEEEGQVYIAMERLRGETLTRRLERGRLDIEQTLTITTQLASAVAAAHARRIVHRDLKPDNIFLVRAPDLPGGDRIKVLDFGIAKLAPESDQENPTAKGSLFGTPAYMAPEQCQDAGNVDHRADLYAIGCIMYEMLSGQPPFGRGGLELLAAHLRDQPLSLGKHVPDVPADIDAIVLRLLAKEPEHRVQSCAELLAGLGRVELVRRNAPHGRPDDDSSTAPTLPSDAPDQSREVSTAPPHRLRVLVVDDNIINRDVTSQMISHLGAEVEVAKNGAEAVAMVSKRTYALVLMDCQMPVMDGYEATREIRGMSGSMSQVPIVAVTAHRLLESREKCLEAGMSDYLTKPLRLDVLRRTLEQWCPLATRARERDE